MRLQLAIQDTVDPAMNLTDKIIVLRMYILVGETDYKQVMKK